MSLASSLVGIAVLGIGVTAVAAALKRAHSQVIATEMAGEIFDMKQMLKRRMSCDKVTALCATSTYVPVILDDCRTFDDLGSRYRARASCQTVAGKRRITVEYQMLNRADSTKLALHPLTHTEMDWKELFTQTGACENSVIIGDWEAWGIVDTLFQKGLPYDGAFRGDDPATLKKICEIAGFQGDFKLTGSGYWSSCGDNTSFKWQNGKFELGPGCAPTNYLLRSAYLTCERGAAPSC